MAKHAHGRALPAAQALLAILFALLLAGRALAAGGTSGSASDPLESARWEDMRQLFFAGKVVRFAPELTVTAPPQAEDALNVPVTVDARRLAAVEEVLVFADFNPIVEIARFAPMRASAYLGLRVKLQQSTPVRAAARTADGVWHVGGTWVNTVGGGCTAPSVGSASPEWQRRLNEVNARQWAEAGAIPGAAEGNIGSRLRLRLIHPMDTGLVDSIPAFHLETLQIATPAGEPLMHIAPREPVSENPIFTLLLPRPPGPLHASGRDNNGNTFAVEIRP